MVKRISALASACGDGRFTDLANQLITVWALSFGCPPGQLAGRLMSRLAAPIFPSSIWFEHANVLGGLERGRNFADFMRYIYSPIPYRIVISSVRE